MPKQDVIDITDVLTNIINEIIKKTPIFFHIDINKIIICIGSNRKGSRGGIFAKVVPLRFENGSGVLKYSGKYYAVPEIIHNGISQLYVIYFYMPRFFDLPYDEKLRVIFHELYHISPEFNGDIRRMSKVKAAHGYSKKNFNSLFSRELHSFMNYISETSYMNFLEMDIGALYNSFKRVLGRKMKNPKPVIIDRN